LIIFGGIIVGEGEVVVSDVWLAVLCIWYFVELVKIKCFLMLVLLTVCLEDVNVLAVASMDLSLSVNVTVAIFVVARSDTAAPIVGIPTDE